MEYLYGGKNFCMTQQHQQPGHVIKCSAGGEANDQSDIDILVTLDKNAHMGLMGFAAMSVDLEGMLNRTVDIVVDDCVKSFARESVDADKMLIYERASCKPCKKI